MNISKLASIRFMLLSFFLCAIGSHIQAQDVKLKPVTRTYAITNATIITAPGQKLDKASIIVEDGVILAVGQNLAIPPQAIVMEADSMYIYPGFIDGLSHVGVKRPKEDAKKEKVKDPGNPPDHAAGIEPYAQVRQSLSVDEKSIDDLRRQGFTVSHTVPYGKMLPGYGALILLAGEEPDNMILKDKYAMFGQMEGAAGVYPNTVMGVMAKYRELYRQAQQLTSAQKQYAQGASGLQRPQQDRVLEALQPVVSGSVPMVYKAEKVLDIQRIIALQKELGFKLTLAEVKEAWEITDKIRSSGAQVFLSLDLPELVEDKADTVTQDSTQTKDVVEKSAEHLALQARKEKMINKYYTQAALFDSLGILYGFSTMEAKPAEIRKILHHIKEKGATESSLLAALTTTPAKFMGLESVLGTLAPGKMGNFIITDKPYFDEESSVKYVFVEGVPFNYDTPAAPKATGEPADVLGTWSYSTETPQGTGTGQIFIKGQHGDYSGTISSSLTGDTSELSRIEVNGNSLSFTFSIVINGNSLVIDVLVEVEGDTFKGSMTAGTYGGFPMEGQRMPE